MSNSNTQDKTVKSVSKQEMHNYICCVDYLYLLGMSSRERVDFVNI